jgi:hypothetical protein
MFQSNVTATPLIFSQTTTRPRFQGYSFAKPLEVQLADTMHAGKEAAAHHIHSGKQADSLAHTHSHGNEVTDEALLTPLSIDFLKQFFQNLMHPAETHSHDALKHTSFIEKFKSSLQDTLDWFKEATRYLVDDSRHLLGLNALNADHAHGHEHNDHHHPAH